MKRSSTEWTSASERDREDLLANFRQQSIESLDIRPYCDLEVLFECEPEDITLDDSLIDRFGFENLQLYLRHAGKVDKVLVIPSDHKERSRFERLVDLELAIRGKDIPLPAILEAIKLKDINILGADLIQKPFTRKAKAIEFLLNLSDIRERIGKVLAFRELFQLRPLPDEFCQIDLKQISAAWRYAYEYAFILAHTYLQGENRNQYQSYGSHIGGWQLLADNEACPYCKRAATKTYSKNKYPKVPLHIGCRCSILPRV